MRRLVLGLASVIFIVGCGQTVSQSNARPVNSNDQRVVADGVNNAPIPTPTPTPVPTEAPVRLAGQVAAVTNKPVNPAPVPVQHQGTFNRIIGPGVNIGIGGSIGNCHAAFRTVPGGAVYFDSCQPGLWFDCHIGTCGGMNGWGAGTVVHYFDGNGTDHVYTIQYRQSATAGQPMAAYGSVHFQVCQQNIVNAPVTVVSA
jgi:hypothetical protein